MKSKKLIFLLGDVLIYYISLAATLLIRYQRDLNTEIIHQHLVPFSLVLMLWIMIFYATDRYGLARASSLAFLKSSLTAGFLNLGAAFAFFYIFRPGIAPRGNLFILFVIAGTLHSLWYALFLHIIKGKAFQKNLLMIGTTPESDEIIQYLKENPQAGYQLKGMLPVSKQESSLPPSAELLSDLIAKAKIKTLVLAENPAPGSVLAKTIFHALQSDVTIMTLPHFAESVTGKIPVKSIHEAWFFEHLSNKEDAWYEFLKRSMDLIGAILCIFLAIPLVPFITLAVALESPGPVFFTQARMGKNGKTFRGIKFRTMKRDAEKNGPQWAQKNDPRVTRVGKVLRTFRIDEIPQFLNILKGDLSFVGPRPERPEFVDTLKNAIPFYYERHLVKPGLTGWAQINFPYGASEQDALEKLQYDLYYIKNKSLVLDLLILVKTLKTVLLGGGSEGRK